MRIRIAHSPDSDDAFMFYPLAEGIIDTKGYEIEHVLKDIETLNREALRGTYEVTAVSFHVYPYISDKYAVLTCGGSVGDGYGPIIVTRSEKDSIKGLRIGIPGKYTTAFLLLNLYESNITPVEMPFDSILSAVKEGEVDAGLIIHEGQISYEDYGLYKFLDLGEWWRKETGLPVSLGCVAVRRDLGKDVMMEIDKLLRESIKYALNNRDEALKHAINYARDISDSLERTDTFVSMYVNRYTVDYGDDGRRAVRLLLRKGYEKGIIKTEIPEKIFVDEL